MYNRQKRWMVTHAALLFFCLGCVSLAYAQQPLSDPTRPVGVSGAGVGGGISAPKTIKWKLTSTLISPQRQVAVINGRVVKVGQEIDGAKLVVVKPGSAMLHHAGKTIQLKLISGTVKHAAVPVP